MPACVYWVPAVVAVGLDIERVRKTEAWPSERAAHTLCLRLPQLECCLCCLHFVLVKSCAACLPAFIHPFTCSFLHPFFFCSFLFLSFLYFLTGVCSIVLAGLELTPCFFSLLSPEVTGTHHTWTFPCIVFFFLSFPNNLYVCLYMSVYICELYTYMNV